MSNILHYFTEFGGWSWLILGALLLLLEVLVPGIFMLWVGIAAIITGLVALTFAIGIKVQLVTFAIAAIAAVLIGIKLFKSDREQSDQPLLNRLGDQLIGQTYTVIEPITQGQGKITIGDSRWSVKGPDTEIGEIVRVTGVDGNKLIVEPVEN